MLTDSLNPDVKWTLVWKANIEGHQKEIIGLPVRVPGELADEFVESGRKVDFSMVSII